MSSSIYHKFVVNKAITQYYYHFYLPDIINNHKFGVFREGAEEMDIGHEHITL